MEDHEEYLTELCLRREYSCHSPLNPSINLMQSQHTHLNFHPNKGGLDIF